MIIIGAVFLALLCWAVAGFINSLVDIAYLKDGHPDPEEE